jgi:hypothetical protein
MDQRRECWLLPRAALRNRRRAKKLQEEAQALSRECEEEVQEEFTEGSHIVKRVLVLVFVLCFVPAGRALAQPTRIDYIAQADPVCLATAQSESRALGGANKNISNGRFKTAARKLRRAGRIFGGGVDQLAALERPLADASLLGTWIDSLRAQVPIVNRFARALNRSQPKRIRKSVTQLILAEDRTSALIDDYGFSFCGQFGA